MPFIQIFDKSNLLPVEIDLEQFDSYLNVRMQQIVKNETYKPEKVMYDTRIKSEAPRLCTVDDFSVKPSLFTSL